MAFGKGDRIEHQAPVERASVIGGIQSPKEQTAYRAMTAGIGNTAYTHNDNFGLTEPDKRGPVMTTAEMVVHNLGPTTLITPIGETIGLGLHPGGVGGGYISGIDGKYTPPSQPLLPRPGE